MEPPLAHPQCSFRYESKAFPRVFSPPCGGDGRQARGGDAAGLNAYGAFRTPTRLNKK